MPKKKTVMPVKTGKKTANKAVKPKAKVKAEAKPAVTDDVLTADGKPPRRFRLSRKGKHDRQPASTHKLPRSFRLYIEAFKMPWRHWEVFGGIILIYGLLNLVLLGTSFSNSELVEARQILGEIVTGRFEQLMTGLTLFGYILTSGADNALSGFANAYQTLLLIMTSLALIWSLRHLYAGKKIRIRDAYYNGMRPLVQYMLVMLMIGVQLIPGVLAGFLYTALVVQGVLVGPWETGLASLLCFLLLALTFYFITSSVFALYIVTLPDMTPWKALTSARDIVRYRRAKVLPRILFLPLALLICAAVIMVPVALLLTIVSPFIFFILTVIAVLIVHSYMYALYRELII